MRRIGCLLFALVGIGALVWVVAVLIDVVLFTGNPQ